MDSSHVQLLVHISASCSARDDARYRKEAHGLLSFLKEDRTFVDLSTLDEKDISTESAPETRHSDATERRYENHFMNSRTVDKTSTWHQIRHAKQGMIRSFSDAEIHQHTTPEADTSIQVGRTPGLMFNRDTPIERPRTAPAVIKETPLGLPILAVEAPPRFDTPPSTVPDSQPSHSSFKRAFMECSAAAALHVQSDTPNGPTRKRSRTAPPVPPWLLVEESSSSTRRQPVHSPFSQGALKRRFGLDGHTSSPSPPKRRKVQSELHRGLSSSDSGVQADAELSSSLSEKQPMIYEDEEMHASSGTQNTSNLHHDPLPLRSSQSFQNRQASQPELEPEPEPASEAAIPPAFLTKSPTGKEHNHPPPLQEIPPPADAPSTSPPSSGLITAPRPPTSHSTFTTHLTNALKIVRSKLQPLDKYYRPAAQYRPVNGLERGCWRLAVPRAWAGDGTRETFWTRLSQHISRGRAGWGTWVERSSSSSNEQGQRQEIWRVWCWGEVLVEIWLLLYVDSSGKTRGVPMRWEDGAGETVVQM